MSCVSWKHVLSSGPASHMRYQPSWRPFIWMKMSGSHPVSLAALTYALCASPLCIYISPMRLSPETSCGRPTFPGIE